MNKLVSMIVALGLATAFAGPTFAMEAPKTKAEGQNEVGRQN